MESSDMRILIDEFKSLFGRLGRLKRGDKVLCIKNAYFYPDVNYKFKNPNYHPKIEYKFKKDTVYVIGDVSEWYVEVYDDYGNNEIFVKGEKYTQDYYPNFYEHFKKHI